MSVYFHDTYLCNISIVVSILILYEGKLSLWPLLLNRKYVTDSYARQCVYSNVWPLLERQQQNHSSPYVGTGRDN